MSATTAETGTQAEPVTQPQAGDPSKMAQPTPQAGRGDELETLSSTELAKMIKDLRKEAGGYRTKLTTLEKAEQQRAEAELSEVDRLKKQLDEKDGAITKAQQRERTYALRDAIEEAVSAEKLKPAGSIAKLLKHIDDDAVEWSDDGKPQNASSLIKGLVKSDSYLFDTNKRVPSADGGAGRESGSGVPSINDQIRRMAGR